MVVKVPLQSLRVLVVERNADVQSLFVDVLSARGYSTRGVATGEEALDLAPSFCPDVVFTSIFIFDVCGFGLCSKLRQMPATERALIVAVSGYDALSGRDLARAVGFDKYLVKPVALTELLETMQHLDGYRGNVVPDLSGTLMREPIIPETLCRDSAV